MAKKHSTSLPLTFDLPLDLITKIEARRRALALRSTSEVVREGLRLLEQREKEDKAKLEWLRAAKPGMLIMCHPGANVHAGDAIAEQRLVEYHFLRSPAFGELLEAARVRLLPLSAIQR